MDNFTFGKYKGHSIKEIIKENPEYVRWCVKNVSFFELTVDQAKELSSQMEILAKIRRERVNKWIDNMYSEDEPYDGWGEDMRACFDPNY